MSGVDLAEEVAPAHAACHLAAAAVVHGDKGAPQAAAAVAVVVAARCCRVVAAVVGVVVEALVTEEVPIATAAIAVGPAAIHVPTRQQERHLASRCRHLDQRRGYVE